MTREVSRKVSGNQNLPWCIFDTALALLSKGSDVIWQSEIWLVVCHCCLQTIASWDGAPAVAGFACVALWCSNLQGWVIVTENDVMIQKTVREKWKALLTHSVSHSFILLHTERHGYIIQIREIVWVFFIYCPCAVSAAVLVYMPFCLCCINTSLRIILITVVHVSWN